MSRKHVALLAFMAMIFCGVFCNQNVHAELVKYAGVLAPDDYGSGNYSYRTSDRHALMWHAKGDIDNLQLNEGYYLCGINGCETYRVWLEFGPDCNGTCEMVHPLNWDPNRHYGEAHIQGRSGLNLGHTWEDDLGYYVGGRVNFNNVAVGIGECGRDHDNSSTWVLNPNNPIAQVTPISSSSQEWDYYQVILNRYHGSNQDIVVVFKKRKAEPEFEGRATVEGGKTSPKSTGYVDRTWAVTRILECPDTGCDVKFSLDLRQKNNGAPQSSTYWVIERLSNNIPGFPNYPPDKARIKTSDKYTDGRPDIVDPTPPTFNGRNLRTVTYDGTSSELPKLLPGTLLCEQLYFGNKGQYAKACAYAKDEPPQKFQGGAGLHLGVRNNSLNENDFVKQVYAKPGDSVTFKADYQSDAQQFANDTSADKVQINGGGLIESNGNPLSSFLSPWNNAFNVKRFLGVSGQRRVSWNKDYKYDTGDSSGHMEQNSYDEIGLEDAGTSIDERASTDDNGNVRTTPKDVSTWVEEIPIEFEDEGKTIKETIHKLVANINTEEMADEAYVRVPYNFRNTTRVTTEDDIVYAGESKTINYDYIINPRENQFTTSNYPSEKYATIVRNPKWKVQLCENDGCSTGSWMDTTVQSASQYIPDLHNGRTIAQKTTLSIRDLPAGSTVCVRSGVYPATSGDPRNYSNANGDGQWAYSAPKCFTVAKKPSLQVWGGNIYSLSGINTHVSKKTNLSGVSGYSYDINRDSARRAFGSWGEQGVIVANGGTTGFSSGASMGYNDNGNALNVGGGGTATGLGGSSKIELCSRVPESFSNISSGVDCLGDGPIQGIGIDTVASTIDSQKNDVIGRLVGDTGGNNWSNDINGGTPIERKVLEGNVQTNISYSYASGGDHEVGDGAIRELTLDGEKTRVFAVRNGSITINSNIKYADASHTSLEGSPKVVIVAIGENSSIRISCNVTRIDGLLVTDGKVDTCYDMSDNERNALERVTESKNGSLFNDSTRGTFNAIVAKSSNPLKINGAVIADKLEAKRTYGAATGLNSIVPGEIINFDPTLYLWGKIITPQTSEGGNNDNKKDLEEGELTITTQHEIAPRL